MIRAVNLGDNAERQVSIGDLQTLSLQSMWLQLIDPSDQELQAVSEKTGIPKGFLELPKTDGRVNLRLEEEFTIIHFVVPKDIIVTKEVDPMVMAFSKSFLVTVEKQVNHQISDTVKVRMSKTKIDPPAMVIYFFVDEIVSTHFVYLEELETLTSKVEEEVVEKTSPETLKKIFKLKSMLISFNKLLWYERSLIFNLKTCGESCMPAKPREMFNTTHEDLTRQIDIVETYREIISDAINVHLSAVSNKINFSIKSLTIVIFYLTIITTVTSFPNTVATFFGISQFGQSDTLIVLVAIVLSILLPFIWLWRKKWLKYDEAIISKQS
jgi:magnesium transporter